MQGQKYELGIVCFSEADARPWAAKRLRDESCRLSSFSAIAEVGADCAALMFDLTHYLGQVAGLVALLGLLAVTPLTNPDQI
jgi:hypothetical protein